VIETEKSKTNVDTSSGERLEGIDNGCLVLVLDRRAARVAQVGHKVSQGVGLDDGNDGGAWSILDSSGDSINVLLVESSTVLVVEEFTVGLGSG
jgi:hypothetical protein